MAQARKIWLEKVSTELVDKSAVLARTTFRHGDEDWLVLWDRFGTAEWEVEQRASALTGVLAPEWRANWFSRVFLQDEYFSWQLMFTSSGTSLLPNAHAKTT